MEKIKLKDFLDYKSLSSLRISKSGDYLGLIVSEPKEEDNSYKRKILVLDTSKKEESYYGIGLNPRDFIFLEDSILFFCQDSPKGPSSFYKLDLDTKDLRPIFSLDLRIREIKDLGSGSLGLIGSPLLRDEEDFRVLDEIPIASGRHTNNKARRSLFVYNMEDSSLKKLTDAYTDSWNLRVHPNKDRLVFLSSSYIDKKQVSNRLNYYDLEKSQLSDLSHSKSFKYDYCDFFSDKIVFSGHNMDSYGIFENPKFYTMNFDGSGSEIILERGQDTVSRVYSDTNLEVRPDFIVDNDLLYYVTTRGDCSHINSLDPRGKTLRLTSDSGSIDQIQVKNGLVYFVGLRDFRLSEVYRLDNREEVRLTSLNIGLEKKKIKKTQALKFTNREDQVLAGYFIPPLDLDESKTYPGILLIQDEPRKNFSQVYTHLGHYLSSQGFGVFFCNPRGSGGRGNDFADIRGAYGVDDYHDLMDFSQHILARFPFIDKDRLGLLGSFYGGFMTSWILGHSSLFKAGVGLSGVYNWTSYFGQSNMGYYFTMDQHKANPWSNIEKLWFHSPLKYAENIHSPCLFIHGQEDTRSPLGESMEMFTALKYYGVDTRLVIVKDEDHRLLTRGKPRSRIRVLEEITNWLNTYLK